MNKGLDVAKMEAAFKRAAQKAQHGTREERSGRFLAATNRSKPSDRDRTATKREAHSRKA